MTPPRLRLWLPVGLLGVGLTGGLILAGCRVQPPPAPLRLPSAGDASPIAPPAAGATVAVLPAEDDFARSAAALRRGDLATAITLQRRGLGQLDGAPADPADSLRFANEQAHLADLIDQSGDRAAALAAIEPALDRLRQLVQAEPQNRDRQGRLGQIEARAAILADRAGNAAAALDHGRRAVEAFRPGAGSGNEGPLADALGNLSWYALVAGDDASAAAAAREALRLDHTTRWPLVNLAHALMFAGDQAGAVAIHQANRGSRAGLGASDWPTLVRADFAALRARGRSSPGMPAIEALLAQP